ncbi:nucleotidyltransferase domain-containing protein [soil metagenome]
MNAPHGLSERTVAQIVAVLGQFPEVREAILFGSRAKGTYQRGSDIDLALRGADLDLRTIGRVSSMLDDLPVPYRFSLIALDERTDPAVAAHVQRVGVSFFERETAAARG